MFDRERSTLFVSDRWSAWTANWRWCNGNTQPPGPRGVRPVTRTPWKVSCTSGWINYVIVLCCLRLAYTNDVWSFDTFCPWGGSVWSPKYFMWNISRNISRNREMLGFFFFFFLTQQMRVLLFKGKSVSSSRTNSVSSCIITH